MMEPKRILIVIGLVCIALAVWIVRKQMRAHECPRHQRSAGIIAWVIAALLSVAGIALLTAAN